MGISAACDVVRQPHRAGAPDQNQRINGESRELAFRHKDMQVLLARRAQRGMAHQPGRGLSLVELLMVIAIIAVVFGILMVILDKTIHVVRSFGH